LLLSFDLKARNMTEKGQASKEKPNPAGPEMKIED